MGVQITVVKKGKDNAGPHNITPVPSQDDDEQDRKNQRNRRDGRREDNTILINHHGSISPPSRAELFFLPQWSSHDISAFALASNFRSNTKDEHSGAPSRASTSGATFVSANAKASRSSEFVTASGTESHSDDDSLDSHANSSDDDDDVYLSQSVQDEESEENRSNSDLESDHLFDDGDMPRRSRKRSSANNRRISSRSRSGQPAARDNNKSLARSNDSNKVSPSRRNKESSSEIVLEKLITENGNDLTSKAKEDMQSERTTDSKGYTNRSAEQYKENHENFKQSPIRTPRINHQQSGKAKKGMQNEGTAASTIHTNSNEEQYEENGENNKRSPIRTPRINHQQSGRSPRSSSGKDGSRTTTWTLHNARNKVPSPSKTQIKRNVKDMANTIVDKEQELTNKFEEKVMDTTSAIADGQMVHNFDVTQQMYEQAKSLWSIGKSIILVRTFLNTTEAVASMALQMSSSILPIGGDLASTANNSATGRAVGDAVNGSVNTDNGQLILSAVDKSVIMPNLKGVDSVLINPLVSRVFNAIYPLFQGTEAMLRPMLNLLVVPRLFPPLRITNGEHNDQERDENGKIKTNGRNLIRDSSDTKLLRGTSSGGEEHKKLVVEEDDVSQQEHVDSDCENIYLDQKQLLQLLGDKQQNVQKEGMNSKNADDLNNSMYVDENQLRQFLENSAGGGQFDGLTTGRNGSIYLDDSLFSHLMKENVGNGNLNGDSTGRHRNSYLDDKQHSRAREQHQHYAVGGDRSGITTGRNGSIYLDEKQLSSILEQQNSHGAGDNTSQFSSGHNESLYLDEHQLVNMMKENNRGGGHKSNGLNGSIYLDEKQLMHMMKRNRGGRVMIGDSDVDSNVSETG